MISFEWLNENNYNECFEIRNKLFDYDFNGNIYDRIIKKDHIDTYKNIDYAVIKNDEGKSIGTIGYYVSKDEPYRCWIGWYGIIEKFRGKGYNSQILKTYIDYIKKNLPDANFLNVYTDYDESKTAIHGYEKVGFKLEEGRFYKDMHCDKWCILGMSLNDDKYIEWNKNPIWCED